MMLRLVVNDIAGRRWSLVQDAEGKDTYRSDVS